LTSFDFILELLKSFFFYPKNLLAKIQLLLFFHLRLFSLLNLTLELQKPLLCSMVVLTIKLSAWLNLFQFQLILSQLALSFLLFGCSLILIVPHLSF
jgi:hypothetical protein